MPAYKGLIDETPGRVVRFARNVAGVTDTDMSTLFGCSRPHVSKLERGAQHFDPDYYEAACDFLRLSEDDEFAIRCLVNDELTDADYALLGRAVAKLYKVYR